MVEARFLFLLTVLLPTVFCNLCPVGISLAGVSLLCPGDVGVYECTVVNGTGLRWFANSTRLAAFNAGSIEGERDPVESVQDARTFAYLLNVENPGSGMGTSRTSTLHYEANFADTRPINIQCDRGAAEISCDLKVMVIGNEELQSLTVRTSPPSDGFVTYMWNPPDNILLVHFLTIVMEDQTIHLNADATQVTLPISAIGNLSVVGFCGQRSEPAILEFPSTSTISSTTDFLTVTTPSGTTEQTGNNLCLGAGIGGFLFGVVIGGVVVAIVFAIVYCHFYRKRKKATAPVKKKKDAQRHQERETEMLEKDAIELHIEYNH